MLRSVTIADPVDVLLAQYVAGALADPLNIILSAHIALSHVNHAWMRDLETLTSDRLLATDPMDLDDQPSMLDEIFGKPRLNPAAPAQASENTGRDDLFPQVLIDYFGFRSDAIPWRRQSKSFATCHVRTDGNYNVDLLKVGAGRRLPNHTHGGIELTLVLAGQFSDQAGVYQRGDISFADETTVHRPMVPMDQDCLCIAVSETAPKLTGRFSRLVNPYLRWSYKRMTSQKPVS